MLRLVLFIVMVVLAACSVARPTATAAPGTFTISPTLSATEVQAGESFVVTTDSGGAGLAHYAISFDGVELSRLSYDGSVLNDSGVTTSMLLVERTSDANAASWTIEAVEPGTYEVLVTVLGEVAIIQPGGGWTWAAADKLLTVTVR